MTPAIIFDADGYAMDGPKLMGRQSAGNGFLRAAVRAHAGQPIHAVSPGRAAAQAFRDLVLSMDAQAQPRWIPSCRLTAIGERGLLYRPDANLVTHARERLRVGPARYSVCGVTHTLSSHLPADSIVDMAAGPVMPWDALICTSTAARTFVEGLLDSQDDYLAWRFGQKLSAPRPQLPVIPLGVHAQDFDFGPEARAAARTSLGLAQDEVAALFAGRLIFNAKAHPFQMYTGLERAARATGRKLVLVLAGQFPNASVEAAFRSAAAQWAPSVRTLVVDGRDAEAFASVWRAADIFVSLSDNIQETFGITPLEAMAAGLPVLVSDWDGYKDTVRDGVDGFRIPTWAPPPGAGAAMALDFETLAQTYDYFLSRTSTAVSLAADVLAERLASLVESPELRRRMGEAGRARVRGEFDWSVVYGRYEALWRELAQIRSRSAQDGGLRLSAAPKAAPSRPDPFTAFGHYPTRHLGAATRVRTTETASLAAFEALTSHSMFSLWRSPPEIVGRVLEACRGEGASLEQLAQRLALPPAEVVEHVARLAKMELVTLGPGPEAP